MKKTLKKQFILFAVITVMMIFAFVLPASAETENSCPVADGTGTSHNSLCVKEVVYPATCTQAGYVIESYCEVCKMNVVGEPYDSVTDMATGHNYKVSYVADGDSFKRVRVCQNPLCQREEDFEKKHYNEIKNYTVTEAGYYSVSFVNKFEAPAVGSADHKSYYLAEFYTRKLPLTWISNGKYDEKVYACAKEETVDGAAAEPDSELILEGGELKLYVKSGKTAPEYKGVTPLRNKDLTVGNYAFKEWLNGSKTIADPITENTVFSAEFVDAGNAIVSYAFYDGNGAALTSRELAGYGTVVEYDEKLKAPSKENDQHYNYVFDGWTLGTDEVTVYTDKIPLYFNADIRAHFETKKNAYQFSFVDFYGNTFYEKTVDASDVKKPLVADNIVYEGDLSKIIGDNISPEAFYVAPDKQYLYERVVNQWEIRSVNGKPVSAGAYIDISAVSLPESVFITEDGVLKEYEFADGDKIAIAPRYEKYIYKYDFKVSIKANYFESEDIFEDNNYLKVDILDKFVIQVTDANGQWVAGGQTNKNGDFYFSAPYSDYLFITAKTIDNNKYYGEHTLELKHLSLDAISVIERDGIAIAPKVTQEWLDGLKHCNCICHSIFSPLIIRIYNIIYRVFGKKYVCCEDLFIVHGNILAYTK